MRFIYRLVNKNLRPVSQRSSKKKYNCQSKGTFVWYRVFPENNLDAIRLYVERNRRLIFWFVAITKIGSPRPCKLPFAGHPVHFVKRYPHRHSDLWDGYFLQKSVVSAARFTRKRKGENGRERKHNKIK